MATKTEHHKHSPKEPTAEEMSKWRRYIAAEFGIQPELIQEEPPPPPDPALVAAGLEIIQGWGAPEPAVIESEQPLPPPSLDFQTVTVYVWNRPSNPRISVRSTAAMIAEDPLRVIADLRSNWILHFS